MTDIKEWTKEYYIENKELCDKILESMDNFEGIPSLNNLPLHSLKDGQLVRFSGMIQDMYNPELYMEKYQVKNLDTGIVKMRSGMYEDVLKCLANEEVILDCDENKNSERLNCLMISIPGLNNWAKENMIGCELNKNNLNDLTKATSSSSTEKRALDNDYDDDNDEPMDTTEPAFKKEKKLSVVPAESQTKNDKFLKSKVIISQDHLINFPIPIVDDKKCVVKIYNDDCYKLNQALDIIGFICLNPNNINGLTLTEDIMDEMEIAEAQTYNLPPPSFIPRLHAIKINQLVPKIFYNNYNSIISKVNLIRSDLHLVLSQLLFGDELAANYVICNLLSGIYTRKDYLCLGNFPLNINGFSVDKFPYFTNNFYDILKLFIAKTHLFECTLDNLNNSKLVPEKDYDSDKLISGILQLSDNTHLIIDETKLIPGQVTPNGKINYKAITDLIKFQKINYDFKYYTIEYETDIPVLILSQVKSFIPCAMQIPLKINEETDKVYSQVIEATKQFLKNSERLNNIRGYFELLHKNEFKLKDDITDIIQQDFVDLRRIDNKLINADSLHQLMVFARFMAISYGEDSLSVERWKQILTLEKSRLARLSK
ncbi:mini-chromosome maintenance complex-binding protein [Cotesia glomerata]|uniref:mini-chromosome maintenance complex-binding protein n=1 Tax=Cotesia glomerata TaxID=32391 RepID=UPI001D02D85A|nr:mini-chromosome maintenance complex-binding protein [Cotesia glomerata]XP_044583275.1 mini-chromosome maintenance complex-binding protein [Cotesia glomerata]